MSRYLITLCYDGAAYHGFQRQAGLPTVQQTVEEALSRRLQAPVYLHGSGRTDAGVHALCQPAHFDYEGDLRTDNFGYAVNTMLPRDIAITSCKRVANDFHARFDAVTKTYLYRVYLSNLHEPLRRHYFHLCFYKLDVAEMRRAGAFFVGEHDFRSFMLADAKRENTVRTLTELRIEEREGGRQLDIFVTGNGFLHNMVRAIAGTLIDVGRGRFSAADVPGIIAARSHAAAGKTLEACGLYLIGVDYGGKDAAIG